MISVTVNIDEKMFDESVGEALKSLKPEEMKDMITNCIKEYLLGVNNKGVSNLETLMYDKENTYYGSSKLKPSFFTEQIIEKLDYSALQEVVDECIKNLKENHKDILEEILLEMMVRGLTDTYNFATSVQSTIHSVMRDMNNPRN